MACTSQFQGDRVVSVIRQRNEHCWPRKGLLLLNRIHESGDRACWGRRYSWCGLCVHGCRCAKKLWYPVDKIMSTAKDKNQCPLNLKDLHHQPIKREREKLGLSIFGPVRFWFKINNQTDFILFLVLEPNRTENRFKPIRFGSVWFSFFPFQTGSNRNFYTCFHFLKNQTPIFVLFSLSRS